MPLLPGTVFYEMHSSEHDLTRNTVALYGLEVPCGDVLVPAVPDFPATVSLAINSIPSPHLDGIAATPPIILQ